MKKGDKVKTKDGLHIGKVKRVYRHYFVDVAWNCDLQDCMTSRELIEDIEVY